MCFDVPTILTKIHYSIFRFPNSEGFPLTTSIEIAKLILPAGRLKPPLMRTAMNDFALSWRFESARRLS